MSNKGGDKGKKDGFEGAVGGNGNGGPSAELEPTARNSNLQQPTKQQEKTNSRAVRAAQAAMAAAQASQIPLTSTHVPTGDQEIGKKGKRVTPIKPKAAVRPRRLLPKEEKKATMMTPSATAVQQQKPAPFSVAALLGKEEHQRHPGSGARTMAINPGSWGKGVKRRAPKEADEDDDGMSGEKLNITQKQKDGETTNQVVDVEGGSREEEEVQDLSKGTTDKAPSSRSKPTLLHKLLEVKAKLAEENAKVKPTTAVPSAAEEMPPPVDNVHKKFEYKRWTAGERANSKQELVQVPNLATGQGPRVGFAEGGPYTAFGPVRGLQALSGPLSGFHTAPRPGRGLHTAPGPLRGLHTASGPIRGLHTAPGPLRGLHTAPGPIRGLHTASGPIRGLHTAPGPLRGLHTAPGPIRGLHTAPGPLSGLVSGQYTPLGSANGVRTAMGPSSSPQITARPPIEYYAVPGRANGAQSAVGHYGGPQNATGRATESYYGAGQVNGLPPVFPRRSFVAGTQYGSGGLANATYTGAGDVNKVTPVKPVSGPILQAGTLRELLNSNTPLQNPYGIVIPVSKGPAPSTVTSSSAASSSSTSTSSSPAVGPDGRPIIPPEQLQRMLGELVLSPFITETQAVSRLKVLGTAQNVQAEIDRFAAIISCGKAFAASRKRTLNGEEPQEQQPQPPQQQQEQEQQRPDNAMSTAARDLLQAKHRDSVIKGVPKK